MNNQKHPTLVNGKICYIEIPVSDVNRSVEFYESVFGWDMRRRGDGNVAFHDGVEVSGAFVLNRPPMTQVGLLIYIMVENISDTADKIVKYGGKIVQPVDPDAHEIT